MASFPIEVGAHAGTDNMILFLSSARLPNPAESTKNREGEIGSKGIRGRVHGIAAVNICIPPPWCYAR